ncbi:MAG: TldD/PmbA family protein [Candidatus Eisenbacteria bacterium]
MDELLTICDRAVQAALDAGADEAEAFAVRGDRVDVQLSKNDIQIAKSIKSDGLGLRVFRGGGAGFAFANTFEEDAVRESVERALGIAGAAPPDEHNGLPDPTPLTQRDGILDPAASSFGVGEAVERALDMLRAARGSDPRVTVDAGELSGRRGEKAVVSSRGVRASEEGSAFYCLILGMARDGDRVSSFDFQFDSSRSAAGIDPVAVARRFADNVVGTLGAVKGESFEGPVILAPKAATDIVSYPVAVAVKASSVQKEISKFAGKLGRRVGSELLTVVDDSSLGDGLATTSFDREGLSPQVLPILERGVLRNYLYDGYTARKEGRLSTGHAGGGASDVPSVACTNVVWSPGGTSLDDMVAGVDRGVLVSRFSGNVDPVSGDFSGSVKGGHMIRAGRLAEPLCGTMIAGNTFELLDGVSAVSVERERLFDETMPYLRLDRVSVSSG